MPYESLGLALVHFGWQGAVVAAALAVALRRLARRGPEIRYGVGVAALVAMVVLPALTFASLVSNGRASDTRAARTIGAAAASGSEAGLAPGAGRSLPVRAAETAGPSSPSGETALRDADRGDSGLIAGLQTTLRPLLGWIVAAWLAGVLVLSVRLAGGWIRLRRFADRDVSPVPDRVRSRASDLADRLAVSRPVRLVRSARVAVPAVAGWLRPVILLPATALTGLSAAQLEAIIAHELAHIRRHDYVVNLLQSVVETLLFYHPAVWWVSRRIREEREHCCDDLAVAVCGDARAYAGALLDLETLRSPAPRLAVAAGGGSLLSRVRRLVEPDAMEVEMFPRWTAAFAATTIALLLTLGGEATGSVPEAPDGGTPGPADLAASLDGTEAGATTQSHDRVAKTPATGGDDAAGPVVGPPTVIVDPAAVVVDPSGSAVDADTIIVYRGGGSLEERGRLAAEAAREDGRDIYWLAYAVRPTPSLGGLIYSDRSREVTTSSISIRGTMRGNFRGFNTNGVVLSEHVGPRADDDVVILLRLDRRGRLSAARLSSFVLPVDVGGEALVWVGGATARESVDLLTELYPQARDTWLEEDLATAVGVHDDADVVVPRLIAWLEGDESDDVRDAAAEWLGRQPDRRSLDALVRASGRDPAIDVRREAVEALGELDVPEATDALMDVARSADREEVRVEAVEALGEREEAGDRVVEALVAFALDDPAERVRREAVEAIGDFPSPRRADALTMVLREGPDSRTRAEAVEAIGETLPAAQAIGILQQEAVRSSDERVAREAVEAIGGLGTRTAGPALLAIVDEHPVEAVQREAVEALGERADASSTGSLERIARDHPRERVRREALETHADVAPADEVIALLVDVASTDASSRLREEALELLIEMKDDAGIEAVVAIARSADTRETRLMAIEALADSDDPRAAEALDRLVPR